jgi:hypothetical protein
MDVSEEFSQWTSSATYPAYRTLIERLVSLTPKYQVIVMEFQNPKHVFLVKDKCKNKNQ